MLALLPVIIVFVFLFIGAVAFLICATLPPTRRYALSAALWCAMWGPCSVVLVFIAGLGLVGDGLLQKSGESPFLNMPRLVTAIGWGYLIVSVAIASIVATIAAILHQFVILRFTFFLFRLYAAAVAAGIGSVFGWSLGWWIMARAVPYGALWWAIAMIGLIAIFGTATYRDARALRGKPPTQWTWISSEEFEGFTSV